MTVARPSFPEPPVTTTRGGRIESAAILSAGTPRALVDVKETGVPAMSVAIAGEGSYGCNPTIT